MLHTTIDTGLIPQTNELGPSMVHYTFSLTNVLWQYSLNVHVCIACCVILHCNGLHLLLVCFQLRVVA